MKYALLTSRLPPQSCRSDEESHSAEDNVDATLDSFWQIISLKTETQDLVVQGYWRMYWKGGDKVDCNSG